jgi:hypothetical protein
VGQGTVRCEIGVGPEFVLNKGAESNFAPAFEGGFDLVLIKTFRALL